MNGSHPSSLPFHPTDIGNSQRLIVRHGSDLRFCRPLRTWFTWDGMHWREDMTGEVYRRAKDTVARIYVEASVVPDDATRKQLADHAIRSEAADRIAAMVRLAESDSVVVVEPKDLDADPFLLNCANGTLDLHTGMLRSHSPNDLITKLAPVEYDPAARSEVWKQTLTYAFPDPEVRTFFQRACGSSLIGANRDEVVFMGIGPTYAAKTTIAEGMKAALGDYSATADAESLLGRRDGGGPRNDLARLRGARLVFSVEVSDGRKLVEGHFKLLTGGDTIVARFLYAEHFEFRPSWTWFLLANHAPVVSDLDDAVWRRIVRVPFAQVPADRRNPAAKALLRDNPAHGRAILAWLVEGCVEWQRRGLDIPPAVTEATVAYREEMNPLKPFVDQVCVLGEDLWTKAGTLRAAYETWARENGVHHLVHGRDWGKRLRALGCDDHRGRGGRGWTGIGLRGAVDGMTDVDGSSGNFPIPAYAREKLPTQASNPTNPSDDPLIEVKGRP